MRAIFGSLVVGALFSAEPALAANITCQGKIYKMIVAPEGDFYVDFGYNRLKLCVIGNTTTIDRGPSHGGTATIIPDRCQAIFASFSTALAIGQTVIAYVERTDCNFTDGQIPNPYPYQFYFLP